MLILHSHKLNTHAFAYMFSICARVLHTISSFHKALDTFEKQWCVLHSTMQDYCSASFCCVTRYYPALAWQKVDEKTTLD